MFGNATFSLVIWGIIFFWLVFLSIIFYNLFSHYQKLTKGDNKKGLKSVLEELLKDLRKKQLKLTVYLKRYKSFKRKIFITFKKIGLVRFNPFSETGGNQSFSLAFLNGEESGLVITSLHSREITRIYSKPVKKGKAEGYELSAEEKQAIKAAKR